MSSPAEARTGRPRKPRHNQPEPNGGDPLADLIARYEATVVELRELLPEVHGAIKDARAAVREIKAATNDLAAACELAAHDAAAAEMVRMQRHMQSEMNRAAEDLNSRIEVARRQIILALTPAAATVSEEGLVVRFLGSVFDASVPLGDEPGPPPSRTLPDGTYVPDPNAEEHE